MIEDQALRGTGRTSRQVTGMPLNGVFVSDFRTESVSKRFAEYVGRKDVRILPAQSLGNMDAFRGLDKNTVVLDHCFYEGFLDNPIWVETVKILRTSGVLLEQ